MTIIQPLSPPVKNKAQSSYAIKFCPLPSKRIGRLGASEDRPPTAGLMRVERASHAAPNSGSRARESPGEFQRRSLWSIQGNLGRCLKGSEINIQCLDRNRFPQQKSGGFSRQQKSPETPGFQLVEKVFLEYFFGCCARFVISGKTVDSFGSTENGSLGRGSAPSIPAIF